MRMPADAAPLPIVNPEHRQTFADVLTRRQEPRKTFVTTLPEPDQTRRLHNALLQGGGAVVPHGGDVMALNLDMIAAVRHPLLQPNGERTMMTQPLLATLTHELQHVRDNKRRDWMGEPLLPPPCREERAVTTEARMTRETAPAGPHRYAYVAPDIEFAEEMQAMRTAPRHRTMLREVTDPRPNLRPEDISQASRRLLSSVLDDTSANIYRASGCSGLTPDEANARARQWLVNAGINPALLNLGTAAAPASLKDEKTPNVASPSRPPVVEEGKNR